MSMCVYIMCSLIATYVTSAYYKATIPFSVHVYNDICEKSLVSVYINPIMDLLASSKASYIA